VPPLREDLYATRTLEEHERKYILSVLARCNGNKTRAAKSLGIDRVSLWRKLKKYEAQGVDLSEIKMF
jgi:transcriptional regulator with PAS, ATPase and Fis domain